MVAPGFTASTAFYQNSQKSEPSGMMCGNMDPYLWTHIYVLTCVHHHQRAVCMSWYIRSSFFLSI